jgi:hypothetical protein
MAERQPMPLQDPEERRRNFNEVALGYTEEQAVAEAHAAAMQDQNGSRLSCEHRYSCFHCLYR